MEVKIEILKNYTQTIKFEEITREPLKAPTGFALSSSSGHIISSDDTDANSFQRGIVDRDVPLYYILTDLEQRDEPFSDHSLNSILQ